MPKARRKRRPRRAVLLLLLLLLALLLPLGLFLAGTFRGGGRLPAPGGESPAPGERGRLRVRVVAAPDGTPVVGATILIEGLHGRRAEGTTGSDGVFAADDLPVEPVRVRARSAQGRASAWVDARLTPHVELSVAPPRMRTGTVTGVASAEVLLLDRHGTVLARTPTERDGGYRLEDREGAVLVAAVSSAGAAVAAGDGQIDFGRGFALKGRIGGSGGLGEILIHARIPSVGDDDWMALRWTAALHEDGGFDLRLPEGTRAWAVVQGRPIALRDGVIDLPAAVRGRGRILGPGGAPAAGAVLEFAPLGEGDAPTGIPATRGEAGADGRFDLPGLAEVAYAVLVGARGCATRRIALYRPAEGELEVTLDAGYELNGFVVDARGLPVEHAELLAVSLPDPGQTLALVRAVADDRGQFRLAGLGGERATIQITAPGFLPTTLDARPRQGQVRAVLPRAGQEPNGSFSPR